MNFSNKTKCRLAIYKAKTFPNLGNGIWKKNKEHYPHILPEENKFENLLPNYRDGLIAYLEVHQIKLHSDFHHLNSSQAMCFNFFYPLYQERLLELITDFLGLTNETVKYETVCFEKDGLEAQFGRKPTSFDFFFETISGKRLHFEIKYTEGGFGKANINVDKFNNVYSKFLKPLNSSFHSSKPFFDNYQILRNLIHIRDNSMVVFIYPKNNDGVRNGVERVKNEFLQTYYHDNFFAATWEKLFDSVLNSATKTNIKIQLIDFKAKYLNEING
jgi:hypothetical protein